MAVSENLLKIDVLGRVLLSGAQRAAILDAFESREERRILMRNLDKKIPIIRRDDRDQGERDCSGTVDGDRWGGSLGGLRGGVGVGGFLEQFGA